MLFSLCEEEDDDGDPWCGDMVGVDYSSTSVQLARRVAAQRHDLRRLPQFEQWDILTDPPDPDWLKDGFDVILDKGTFDAISLMQRQGSQHPCEIYRSKVTPLMKPGAFLFVTSCNWTKDELISWLTPPENGGELRFYDEAAYPTFTFGGKEGQSVVTVICRRSIHENDG